MKKENDGHKNIWIAKCGSLLIVMAFCVAICTKAFSAAENDEEFFVYCEIENAVRIDPQTVDGESFLFLPSYVDYSCVDLKTNSGAIITNETREKELLYQGKPVDIYELYEDAVGGVQYKIVIKYEGKEHTVYLIKSENIPALFFSLEGDLSYIHEDKSNTLSGEMVLLNMDGSVQYVDIEIFKGRGNATWSWSEEKRPYNFKAKQRVELIPGAGKAKRWCLLSNNSHYENTDHTGLANALGYSCYDVINGAYALKTEFVDLYVNREYRGTYYLTEKIEIDKARVDISESAYLTEDKENATTVTAEKNPNDELIRLGIQKYRFSTDSKASLFGGYLLEQDFRYESEPCWFVTRNDARFVLKEPEYASREQVVHIASFVQEFEDALISESGFNSKGRYYAEYVDLSSLAKMFLADCFFAQGDMFLSSSFFSLDTDAKGEIKGKLVCGPLWDNDWILIEDSFIARYTLAYTAWTDYLFRRGDFVYEMYKQNTDYFMDFMTDVVETEFDEYVTLISASEKMNELLWQNDFANGSEYLKEKLKGRLELWKNEFWNDKYLHGAIIDEDLQVECGGRLKEVMWYKVDELSGLMATSDPNEMKNTLIIAGVKGYNGFKVPNMPGCILGEDTIVIYTNPIRMN